MKLFTQELGIKSTPLAMQSISIGAAFIGLSNGIFSLSEAFLLIIAVAETINTGFDYFNAEVNEP